MPLDPMQSARPRGKGTGAKNRLQADAERQGHDNPSLLDGLEPSTGDDRREAGQQAAIYASDVRGISAAETALEDLAASGEPFTAEDLRERVGAPLGARDNAMGGLFSQAAKRGLIVHVGYTKATRPEAHGRVLRVWKGAA